MPFSDAEFFAAIEKAEFVPYFQPLVELRSGNIEGFEVLARWQHPQHGTVPPNDFIPHLERLGLMNDLTRSLLRKTFHAANAVPERIGFSVNVSPAQLLDRTLASVLQHKAEELGFDLRRLTVELTESALLEDLHRAGEVAADLKALGIKLALDDFGTGYSSLLHLQALPFDELKIDASFVRTMTQSRQSRKITSAVVSLGQSLGLRTIAEGVEEKSQAELLLWHGCNLAQGWLYERAVPAERLGEVLARQLPVIDPSAAASPEFSLAAAAINTRPVDRVSQLRAIYDGAPVGLSFLDPDLRYVSLNQRLAEMHGLPIQAHVGRKAKEVAPEFFKQNEPYLRRALAGEAISGVEVPTPPPAPGGPPGTLLISYQPARDEAGEVIGVSVSVVDISTLKRNEAALRESEDHYRHTVELNPQIPWVTDPAGRSITMSSRWEVLTGTTREQAIGHGWLEAVHPEDMAQVVASWNEAVRQGRKLDMEFRVLGADGEWHWVRTRGAPRRNDAGEIMRWYGSVEEIDDYKLALEKLSESEARQRTIINAVPVGIVLAEAPSGKIVSANPRAEAILGRKLPPGTLWSNVMNGAYDKNGVPIDPENMPLLKAIRRGERTVCFEVCYPRTPGPWLWLSLSAAPIIENGKLIGGVVAAQVIERPKSDDGDLMEKLAGLAGVSLPPASSSQVSASSRSNAPAKSGRVRSISEGAARRKLA